MHGRGGPGGGPQDRSSAAWHGLAANWLDEQLTVAGIARTGELGPPRIRPWGTVMAAPTDSGRVWLKAPGPATAFEVGLYELLHRVAPGSVLAPIAADVARGWIVLPDGGEVLGERTTGGDLVDALVTALPLYGHLQRTLASHVESLLAVGVTDMRPAIMPTRFDQALEAVGRFVDRHGSEDERVTHDRVATVRATFAAWCERLAGAPAEASLDHNDLHPWNIFAEDSSGSGTARFYDWGDSVVAHPFSSMLVALGFLRKQLPVGGKEHPGVLRVRDAYLDVFSDLAPHAELVETMELACQVGKVARSLVWDRALGTMGPDEDSEDMSAPLYWLASLLDHAAGSRA